MKFQSLSTFLAEHLALSEETTNAALNRCNTRQIKAGDFLLREGESCKSTFFVEEGVLRKYGIDTKGREIIVQFAPENWFVTDRESSYFHHPSLYFIQALESCTVAILDADFILSLSQKLPGFEAFNNRLLHNHIRQQTKRIYELLSATAEERYLSFIKTYPDITFRVPQWMIASYLGITPESLSRVRRELAQRNSAR